MVNSLRRQEKVGTPRQTKQGSHKSTVASGKKKTLDSQSTTFLVTEGDKKKYGNSVYIRKAFDFNRNEATIDGSSGPIQRLGQLQGTAKNSGLKIIKSDLDHSLSSRMRQGLDVFRRYDINIVEAIFEDMHQLFTNAGPVIYNIEPGVISITDITKQILANRIKVFQGEQAKDIMANQLHKIITPQDYINGSERGAALNRRLMHRIATERGLRIDSVKSLLLFSIQCSFMIMLYII